LGDVITLQRGYDLPAQNRRPGNVPIVTSSGITGYHDTAKAKGPGVVTGRYGTLGEAFYIKDDFWPHNTALFVRDFKGNDPLFVRYLLTLLNFSSQNAAGAVPGVNRNALHLMPVRVPSASVQRRIAGILSAYDDLIENNLRRIKILEEMAQALYREWFVEFRFPGHERVRMVDSALGKIPEGWEARKLGEHIEFAYGKGLTEVDRSGGAFPVYGSSGIVGRHGASLVKGPGIIVGRKGNVGSVYWSDEDFFPIDTVYYVKTYLCLHYVYFNLRHQNFINNDAAVPGLNRRQAYSLPLLVPAREVLDAFESILLPIFAQIRVNTLRNAVLRATRDLLLPKLVSGEVAV